MSSLPVLSKWNYDLVSAPQDVLLTLNYLILFAHQIDDISNKA